jgi:hypothetical protein
MILNKYNGLIIFLIVAYFIFVCDSTEKFTSINLDKVPMENGKYVCTESNKNKIFISVASYRDDECPITIKSIYDNAKYPDNIFIGLCQQNKKGDVECKQLKERGDQIRTLSIDYTEANGPTYARYLCAKLWEGEEYFLQIDSHTLFVKNWDEIIIKLLNECPSKKSVLTYYPKSRDTSKEQSIDVNDELEKTDIPYTCASGLDSNDIPIPRAALITNPNRPLHVLFIAAGFIFTKGEFLIDVPFDPDLPYLFMGEEFLLSARLWTHGYDMFLPTKNICTHHYTRQGKPKFWEDHPEYYKENPKSIEKVKKILQYDDTPMEYQYGLGTVRSLKEYLEFSGIDLKNKKTQDFCYKEYDSSKKEWIPLK